MSCCEPKNAVHGLLLADVLGLLADHDAELDLPVQLVSDAGQGEVTTRPDHTGRKLVKHHWFFGNGSSLFLAMVLVVHSNTENLNKSISIKEKGNKQIKCKNEVKSASMGRPENKVLITLLMGKNSFPFSNNDHFTNS